MQCTKLTLIFVCCLILVTLSCSKKQVQQEPSCTDGFLNNGETGIDCGGPCAPCLGLTNPVFFATFNGQFTYFNNVSVQYGDTIYIHAITDSIQVNLSFKNLTVPDENNQLNPIVQSVLPFVSYFNTDYSNINPQYSVISLSKNENNRISGLFQLFLPHGFENMDTLKVVNGTFENIAY